MIVILGPKGTNSHDLAKTLYLDEDIILKDNFNEVFEFAHKNKMNALVPIENSSIGKIDEVVNLIEKYNFSILKTIDCPIKHYLLSKHDVNNLSQIKKVYSQVYAAKQCQKFINENLKNVELILTQSTSSAAKAVSDNNLMGEASIGSLSIAKELNLIVLANEIQDDDNNVTKFAVMAG